MRVLVIIISVNVHVTVLDAFYCRTFYNNWQIFASFTIFWLATTTYLIETDNSKTRLRFQKKPFQP
ncbi:hypothetical protein BS17DRAFT_95869 [Gyrodon lividus]|nr:hypothetical protein BS17DRAFT_95869 [Gyrodon lividus]